MWSISDLKQRGKTRFKANYLMCVIAGVVFSFFTNNNRGINIDINGLKNSNNTVAFLIDEGFKGLFPTSLSKILIHVNHIGLQMAGFVLFVFSICLVLFVVNILEVGVCNFFNQNRSEAAGLERIIEPFRNENYMQSVKTMFLRYIYIFLWSLLLVIPGIYKSYEYRMVPYIVSEYPELSDKEVFARSKQMMMGQKLNAFILDLSFIGWAIFGVITFGIGVVLYVQPYICATNAELYAELKYQL